MKLKWTQLKIGSMNGGLPIHVRPTRLSNPPDCPHPAHGLRTIKRILLVFLRYLMPP